MNARTIALGVDGMERELFERWSEAGELPNLTEMVERGVVGGATCSSLNSAQQWTTHFTGVHPGTHGVQGFRRTIDDSAKDRADHGVKKSPDVQTLINLEDVRTKTYPELLDGAGVETAVINPLPVWPALELENGVCVAGLVAPPETERWYHPESLESLLEETGYRIDVQYGNRPYGFVDDGTVAEYELDRLYEEMFEVLDARIEFTKRILLEEEPTFLYSLLKTIDIIQHVFWIHMEADDERYGDAILDAYRRVDDLAGWIRETVPDANVILFSDHGFQRRQTPPPYYIHRVAKFVKRFLPGVPFWFARAYYELLTSDDAVDVADVDQISGEHDQPAMWLAAGPAFEAGTTCDIDFEDLTPTILATLGEPVPNDYAGAVPERCLTVEPSYAATSLDVSRRVQVAADEVVTDRLHNLGYAEMVEED